MYNQSQMRNKLFKPFGVLLKFKNDVTIEITIYFIYIFNNLANHIYYE